jgi:hypothetical protein
MDNEIQFVPEQPMDEELFLYEEGIKKIDSFIRIVYEIMSYETVSGSERENLETMADVANTMEIQMLETLQKRNGNIEFMDEEEY